MKIIRLLLLFCSFETTICFAQMTLDLAAYPTNQAIECDPNSLRIGWMNTSDGPLQIGPEFSPDQNSAVAIIVNDQVRLRLPRPSSAIGERPVVTKTTLDPGEKITGFISVFELRLDPGDYRIRAVADFGQFPEGYFHGLAESNTINLHFSWPSGEDLMAYEWAFQKAFPSKEKYEEELKRSSDPRYGTHVRDTICGQLGDLQILKLFPRSIYSSYLLYHSIQQPHKEDPSGLVSLIKSGWYPHTGAVTDPDAGEWREINTRKAMAQWQIRNSQRILENHPNFPFANELRINIAVSNVVLGKNNLAREELSNLSEKGDSVEARWAVQFLQFLQL